MPSETSPLVGGNDDDFNMALYHLEERRRRRIMTSLAVLTLVCAMMGALLVWRLAVANQQRREAMPFLIAAEALDGLNRHITLQSKHVTKECRSTLLIMRHCEKEGPYTTDPKDGSEHCSYIGYERAHHIASLFGDNNNTRWPAPSHLFVLTPDRGGSHLNFREWETLKPLSDVTGLVSEIHSRVSLPPNYFELLQSGTLCDEVAVVSWKHEFIPELARNLACGPHNGCPSVYPLDSFDQVWQLTYVFHPSLPIPKRDENDLQQNGNFTALNGSEDDSEGDNDNGGERRRHRNLKHHQSEFSKHGWNVYATINYQNFDPLAFRKQTMTGDFYAAAKSSYKKSSSSRSYNADGGL